MASEECWRENDFGDFTECISIGLGYFQSVTAVKINERSCIVVAVTSMHDEVDRLVIGRCAARTCLLINLDMLNSFKEPLFDHYHTSIICFFTSIDRGNPFHLASR